MTANLSSAMMKASGGSTSRSLGTLVAPVFNVKDYGAVGDGSANDTDAIQAAITAACSAGVATGGSFLGGTVYFPPGAYKVVSAIDLTPGNSSGKLLGAGKKATMIFGDIASSYVMIRADAENGIDHIEGMLIKNTNTSSGSGGLRFLNSQQGSIRDCSIQGFNALDVSSNVYCTTIYNTDLSCQPGNGTGTVGAYTGQAHFIGCSVSGCATGVQASNSGFVWLGGRAEVNGTAFMLGMDSSGSTSQLSGFLIAGFTTEGNITDFNLNSVKAGQIGPGTCTGVVGEAHDDGSLSTIRPNGSDGITATSCIYMHGAQAVLITGLDVSTKTVTAGINLSDASLSAENVTFDACRSYDTSNASGSGSISGTTLTITGAVTNLFAVGMVISGTGVTVGTTIVRQITGTLGIAGTYQVSVSQTVSSTTITGAGGVGWKMPTTSKAGINFQNSNNPTAAFLYHDLPGEAGFGAPATAVEGMEFNISDGAKSGGGSAAVGDTVQGGGSQHLKVRRNSSAWTCCGV